MMHQLTDIQHLATTWNKVCLNARDTKQPRKGLRFKVKQLMHCDAVYTCNTHHFTGYTSSTSSLPFSSTST